MHELALTQGIIDIVVSEQEKQGFKDVREIRLKVGEYSGIVHKGFFPGGLKGDLCRTCSSGYKPYSGGDQMPGMRL